MLARCALNSVSITYVFQVFHDVEEIVGLLARVAHRVDGFSDDQVFGDFGPHVPLPLLYGTLIEVDINIEFLVVASSTSTTVAPGGLLACMQDTREFVLTLCD
jgi:hypothetical protein